MSSSPPGLPLMLALVAAMAGNRVIGAAGTIPWHIPEDLARFRRLTLGQTVIMGRKTFESIGHPLPERTTIVVSRRAEYAPAGVLKAGSLEQALLLADDCRQVFICGGGEVYARALPLVQRIYLTLVEGEFAGDTFFPPLPEGEFVEISREKLCDSPAAYFTVLERIAPSARVQPG